MYSGGGNRLLSFFYRHLFGSCGVNVHFSPINSDFSYEKINIGSDVYIGPYAMFSAIKNISIGNKVIFGPHVTIMAGDHNIKEIGKFIYDVKNKNPEDDLPVKINDDVWVGCNVTILKGVMIGRGAVVAACSLVTKDVPPYAIVGGVPAKVLKFRWNGDVDTLMENELILYGKEGFSRDYIEQLVKTQNAK